MDGAQGRKGGILLCMDERRTTGKSITQQDNVTEDIRDLISHSKKEIDGGESSKGQIESQVGLHLGLKEQKNKFRDQEGARYEATRSKREKSRIKWLEEENKICSNHSQINQMAKNGKAERIRTAGGEINKAAF